MSEPAALNLFEVPRPSPVAIEQFHPPARLADYALLAANTDAGAAINAMAATAMIGILKAFGSAAIWEVRIALGAIDKLANDGKEKLDCLGTVGASLHLIGVGYEAPPLWARPLLRASNGNKGIIWVFPDAVTSFDALGRRRRFQQQDEIWLAAQREQRKALRAAAKTSGLLKVAP